MTDLTGSFGDWRRVRSVRFSRAGIAVRAGKMRITYRLWGLRSSFSIETRFVV